MTGSRRSRTAGRSRRGFPRAEFRDYEGGHAFLVQDPAAVGDLVGFLGDDGQRVP